MTPDPSDVKRVLGSSDLSNSDIKAEIQVAENLYEERIDNESVPQNKKDNVVTRLTAHLIASGPERQIEKASEGDGSVTFSGETGEGLQATTHGQMAIILDPTGQLDGTNDEFTLSA